MNRYLYAAHFDSNDHLATAVDCDTVVQENELRVDCVPFTVYFDGLLNAHLVLKNVAVGDSGSGSGSGATGRLLFVKIVKLLKIINYLKFGKKFYL